MSFDAGAIVGRLVLDTSGFQASAAQASRRLENLGGSIVSVSKQLSRAASNLTFLGAGLTAPIVAAFKSAEKYSNSTRTELEKMNNTFISLRVSIAESLLPVMHQFGNAIADLVQRWQALSPSLRESMLRTALLTGVFFTLGGIISTVALKIITLIGYAIKMSAVFATFAMLHPGLLLIRVAIVGIALAMFKWKEIGDIVMNTFQILFNMASMGLNTILGLSNSLASAFFAAATGALKFASATSVWPAQRKLLGDMAEEAWKLAQAYSDLANNAYKRVGDAGADTFRVLASGQSDFSRGFDDMKAQTSEWVNLFKDLGGKEIDVSRWQEASKTFAQGWQDSLDKTRAALSNWGELANRVFTNSLQVLETGFSELGMSIIGMGEDIQKVFENLGRSIIQMLMDVIAKWIAGKVMMGIGSAVSSIGGALGWGAGTASVSGMGTVKTAPANYYMGHADGIDITPYTGLYKLHEGERVVPKYDASKGNGNIELTIINQITPEAVATAMTSKEGSGVIVNTIDANALRNGSTRRVIRRR